METVIARTDVVQDQCGNAAASYYVTFVGPQVLTRLVEYHAAVEGLPKKQATKLLEDIWAWHREQNVMLVLLSVRPAPGTSLRFGEVRFGPVGSLARPKDAQAELHGVIDHDVDGFVYFSLTGLWGQPRVTNDTRTVEFSFHAEYADQIGRIGNWLGPEVYGHAYIDLKAPHPLLGDLKEVVKEHLPYATPEAPKPQQVYVNPDQDLTLDDLITMIELLSAIISLVVG